VDLIVAEVLATCAVAQRASGSSNAHSTQVKTFRLLNELHDIIEEIELEGLKGVQPTVEKALKEILRGHFTGSSLSPTVYKLIGRIWVILFNQGDTRNLLGVAGDLQDTFTGKSPLSVQGKTAVLYCLGEICTTKKARILSGHLRETVGIVGKIFKVVNTSQGGTLENALRVEALKALAKGITGSGSAGVSVHGDVVKLLNKVILDKAWIVRETVAEVVTSIGQLSIECDSVSLSSLVTICSKCISDVSLPVRLAHARALGILVGSSIEHTQVASKDSRDVEAGNAGGSSSPSKVGSPTSPVASPSTKTRSFNFSSASWLGSRGKEGPESYTLDTGMDMIYNGFESWAYNDVAKTREPQLASDPPALWQRCNSVRLAYIETSIQVMCHLQRGYDVFDKYTIVQKGVEFVQRLCDDDEKRSRLATKEDRHTDDAFRRTAVFYFLSSALASNLSENGKIELARLLLNECTATADPSRVAASPSQPTGGKSSKNFKRRQSRSLSTGSATNRQTFKHNALFLAPALSQISCILSSLGDACRALKQELDFQVLLPLVQHRDKSVRQETCGMLYVCAITQPGYAAKGILPLLQYIGLYQAELAVALVSFQGTMAATTSEETDTEAERTLWSIEGLVHALCAFVCSSSANGRPKSTSVEAFLKEEIIHLPWGSYPHSSKQQMVSVANSSSALTSGDLKSIPTNISIALLGYAKSMISRQIDGAMDTHATACVASGGWAIISALVTLGPGWCTENIAQLFQAWQTSVDAATPMLPKEGSNGEDLSARTALYCLKSSMFALANFVRCNQLLLQDLAAVSRGIIALMEQVLAYMPLKLSELPHKDLFMGLHIHLFDICSWLPRDELGLFKRSVVEKLHCISMAYFLNGHHHQTKHGVMKWNSLLDSPGVLFEVDNVLSSSMPLLDSVNSHGLCARSNWRFDLNGPCSKHFELAMNAKQLSSNEANDTMLSCMSYLSCNMSHLRVCSAHGNYGESAENLPFEGMVLIPDPQLLVRCADAAIAFSTVTMSCYSSDRERDKIVQTFVTVLKRNSNTIQSTVLSNVLTVIAGFLNHLSASQREVSTKKATWLGKLKGILCVAISSTQQVIRRTAAQCLGILTRVAGSGFGFSVVQTLTKRLEAGSKADPGSENSITPFFKSGFVLTLAIIRREASMHDTRFVKNNTVYEMCKVTSQPVRTWALHSWQQIVECSGMDIAKFVKPSLALINAHLLTVDGDPIRGAYGSAEATTGAYICIARLLNTLIEGLGPELARDEEESLRFVSLWKTIYTFSDHVGLQYECVKMIQQILLFHPSLLTSRKGTRGHIAEYLQRHALGLENLCEKLQVLALNTFQLLAEKTKEESSILHGSLALVALEITYRRVIMQDWVIPPLACFGFGAYVIRRSSLPNRSRDPLLAATTASDTFASSFSSAPTAEDLVLPSKIKREDSWLALSNVRFACFAVIIKLIGISQHDLSCETVYKKTKLSTKEMEKLQRLTGWMLLLRGVMTGTIDQKDGVQYEDEEAAEDDEESENTDNEANLRAFIQKILGKCSWETKVLAVEGMLELLTVAKGYRLHSDPQYASKVLENAGIAEEGQFIGMHLRELLSGACQAANGTIQSAEIPQVSILGYCTLISIVRMFAHAKDPKERNQSILKQYEMQLTATLGPGLSPSASPLILPYVSTLGLELLESNVSSSAGRIVGLLLPPELREEEDDSDDEGVEVEDIYDDYPRSVRVEVLISRLSSLARLWLFASGVDSFGRVDSVAIAKKAKGKKRAQQNCNKDVIEKAILKVLDSNQGSQRLKDAWGCAISDLSVLMCPLDAGKRLSKEALSLADTEDGQALIPVYLDAFWIISRALASISTRFEVDTKLILFANMQFASVSTEACPLLVFGNVCSTIEILLSTQESLGRPVYSQLLEIIGNTHTQVVQRTVRGQVTPEDGAVVLVQVFTILLQVVKSKAFQAHLQETQDEYALLNELVQVCTMPTHSELGTRRLASFSKGEAPSQSLRVHTKVRKLLENVTPRAIQALAIFANVCPAACKLAYTEVAVFQMVATITCSENEDAIKCAANLIPPICNQVDQLKCTVFYEMMGTGMRFIGNDDTKTSADMCLLVAGHLALCSTPDDEIVATFLDALEKVLADEESTPGSKLSCVSTLQKLLRISMTDAKYQPTASAMVARLGTPVSLLIRTHGSETELCSGAILSMTEICVIYPATLQFILVALLSLAEGDRAADRPNKLRQVARGCLVTLATKCASEFKTVVQGITPAASEKLQTAMKQHFADQQAAV